MYIFIYIYISYMYLFPYENHCTANVTKSKYQDCGQCYMQLPIFCLYIHLPLLLKNKKLL